MATKKPTVRKPAPVDRDAWSAKSRQTLAYEYAGEHYEDIAYDCWRCGVAAVYTAQDQKRAYEIKKAHIDQRRKFCGACWGEELRIAAQLAQAEAAWKADRKKLKADRGFLESWLALLERHVAYGARRNTAAINRLKKLIRPGAGHAA